MTAMQLMLGFVAGVAATAAAALTVLLIADAHLLGEWWQR